MRRKNQRGIYKEQQVCLSHVKTLIKHGFRLFYLHKLLPLIMLEIKNILSKTNSLFLQTGQITRLPRKISRKLGGNEQFIIK